MDCNQPLVRAFRVWVDWLDRAPAILSRARRVPARRVSAACKRTPDLSERKENAPSTQAPCFGTREFAPPLPPGAQPDSQPPPAVRSTSAALAPPPLRFCRQK